MAEFANDEMMSSCNISKSPYDVQPVIDSKYILHSYLGYGGTSKVFESSLGGRKVAVKCVRKDKNLNRKQEKGLVFTEAEITQEIGCHPNIINLLASNQEGIHEYMGITEEVSYNVFEYCPNGSLFDYVKKYGPLEEYVACFYFKQLVYAVKHLHDQNIAHCDIKPGNIFLDEFYNVKLGDFGCALKLKNKNYGVTKCFGTKSYMAPEIFKASSETPFDPFAADIFALGCTLYFMLTGKVPCTVEISASTEEDSDTVFSPSNAYIGDLEDLDLMTYDMIERCTCKDPTERPGAQLLTTHPWFDDREDEDYFYNVFTYMSGQSAME